MSGVLAVRNRQRSHRIDLRLLRRMLRTLLHDLLDLEEFEIRVLLVSSQVITRINESALQHQGPTDVITFDLSDPLRPGLISGEIYVCPEVASTQARRFRTNWQSELVRYAIHGALHLAGYDDLEPAKRRVMKRSENKYLAQIGRQYSIAKLGGHWRREQ